MLPHTTPITAMSNRLLACEAAAIVIRPQPTVVYGVAPINPCLRFHIAKNFAAPSLFRRLLLPSHACRCGLPTAARWVTTKCWQRKHFYYQLESWKSLWDEHLKTKHLMNYADRLPKGLRHGLSAPVRPSKTIFPNHNEMISMIRTAHEKMIELGDSSTLTPMDIEGLDRTINIEMGNIF